MKQASLPLETLHSWSHFNDIRLSGASVEPHIVAPDGTDKGGGLVATVDHGSGEVLLAVPMELLLSKERVEQCAKEDKNLRELIEAVPSLFQTPRAAVLLFLVWQMTINSSDAHHHGLGFHNPFADYLKFLPKDILLPTFYTSAERDLLFGTSLSDALEQKSTSLEREFDNLKEATQVIPWCQRVWWDDQPGCLDIGDWKLADAIYRSRALELPRGAGVGMVPVVDMANHASDDHFNARFEVDEKHEQVLLVVRDNKSIHQGDEITIMYGVGGACEMIFSYGFLDEHATSAREMFLNLSISSDDPLRQAKIRFAQEAPGVRLYVDDQNEVKWESTFVWWACVNQEDGLDFRVEQAVTGDTELKAVWNDQDLQANALQPTLHKHHRYDLFLLRAIVTIQQRVEEQGMRMAQTQDDFEGIVPDNVQIRTTVYETIGRLRSLEMDLLSRAYETLETQKDELLKSATVSKYLDANKGTALAAPVLEEDFS